MGINGASSGINGTPAQNLMAMQDPSLTKQLKAEKDFRETQLDPSSIHLDKKKATVNLMEAAERLSESKEILNTNPNLFSGTQDVATTIQKVENKLILISDHISAQETKVDPELKELTKTFLADSNSLNGALLAIKKVKDQENVPIEIDGQPPKLRPSSVMGMPVMLEIISQRLAGLDTGLKNMAEETGIIFPKQGNVFNDGPHIDINDGDTNSDFNKNTEFILNDSK